MPAAEPGWIGICGALLPEQRRGVPAASNSAVRGGGSARSHSVQRWGKGAGQYRAVGRKKGSATKDGSFCWSLLDLVSKVDWGGCQGQIEFELGASHLFLSAEREGPRKGSVARRMVSNVCCLQPECAGKIGRMCWWQIVGSLVEQADGHQKKPGSGCVINSEDTKFNGCWSIVLLLGRSPCFK